MTHEEARQFLLNNKLLPHGDIVEWLRYERSDDQANALAVLLAPPVWHTLESRPLTKEDVGKWAWIWPEGANKPWKDPCEIGRSFAAWLAYGEFYFAKNISDKVERYSIIGFPPPAPKEK